MSFLLTLVDLTRFFDLPDTPAGWLGWFAVLALLAILLWRWRRFNRPFNRDQWAVFGSLLLLTPLTTLFLGLRLPEDPAAPLLGISLESGGPALMLFSALPWVLAASLLGPAPAAILAAFSGVLSGYFETHSLFTPLELALVAVLLSAALRQRYRTLFYRFLRHPVGAAFVIALFYPLIFVALEALYAEESLVLSLTYALTRVGSATFVISAQLLVAAIPAWLLARRFPDRWHGQLRLRPSPAELSLEGRFLYRMLPLGLVFFVVLVIGAWNIAGRLAEQLLQDRLGDIAAMAAESVPISLETGQNLVLDFARDPRLYILPAEEVGAVLADDLRTASYFHELLLLDRGGGVVAAAPVGEASAVSLPSVEREAIGLALQGIPFQFYTTASTPDDTAAKLSFVAAVLDDNGDVQSVLLARTRLGANPFLRPVIDNLARMEEFGGSAFLLDSSGLVIYHTLPDVLMTSYSGPTSRTGAFFDRLNYRGAFSFLHYQPVPASGWAVVTTLPVQRAQQLAYSIALPLLAVLLVMVAAAFLALRIGLRAVNLSLQDLVVETNRIAAGDLERPLSVEGVDEIGLLRAAFERMRAGLKARLDEINRLLVVSRSVASTLNLEGIVLPILEAALTTGASSSRLVLSAFARPDLGNDGAPPRFGHGPSSGRFSPLDEQVLALTRRQPLVVLTNPSRAGLRFDDHKALPGALLAIALRHENANYGALWIAFDGPHKFTDDEVRFVTTVAGQAAMAAGNARLFRSAQLGRRRLEAVLASTPDPVLVTDEEDCILLVNPSAIQLLGGGDKSYVGLPIDRAVLQPDLLALFRAPDSEPQSREIAFPDGRIYYVSLAPILTEGRRIGRICVLRDVTSFKELDALKTDLVGMVSNELRSPLALVQGYTTMLSSMGGLNQQQADYVRKIAAGLDGMSRLVGDLLDLRRMEAGLGLKLERLPVVQVVNGVVTALRLEAGRNRITLSVETPQDSDLLLEIDRSLVEQALQNLIANAIQYSHSGGEVQILISEQEDGVRIAVKDEGVGVAPIDLPHLFDRFYRPGGRQRRAESSSGLGLALVKSVADLHHGRVWLESQLGSGSTFYLFLPYRQPSRHP